MLPSILPARLVSDETDYRYGLNEEEEEEFELLVQAYIKDMHYTSVNQAALNITYSMINVGLVGIPFVAYEAGIPIFGVSIIIFSILSIYTTSMVLEMADDVQVRSLEDLSEKAFGPRGYFATCLLQILFSMLLMCITLDVWGDIMPQVLRTIIGSSLPHHTSFYHFLTHRRTVILLGTILILPLCFVRSMSKLSWFSYLTVCALLMSVIFVLIALFGGDTCNDGDMCHLEEVYQPRGLWWTVQPLLTFCFTYQQKLFFVYNCLRRRSVPRIRSAITASHCFVGLMYLLFGVLAALNSTQTENNDDENSDLTLNYFAHYAAIEGPRSVYDITRGIVAVSLLYTLPVDCLVAVTTWRRFRRRYIRHLKNRDWEQDAFDIQPESFTAYRKGSDDAEERGGLLSEERSTMGQRHKSQNLIDEDDVICVEMMRLGGCLAPKEGSFSQQQPSRNYSASSRTRPDPNASPDEFIKSKPSVTASTSTSLGTSATSLLSLEPSRHSFPNSPHSNEYLTQDSGHHLHHQQQQQQQHNHLRSQSVLPPTRPDLKVSFHHQENLPRVSEYSDDMSTARTVAWNRHTFEGHQQTDQSNTDDQSTEGMNRVTFLEDDAPDVGRGYPSEVSEEAWKARRSSVGPMHERRRSAPDYINHGIIVSIILGFILILTTLIKSWIIWASFFGSVITSIFAFILPSMIYFRLGLRSDFQSIPLIGSMIPNRLFMLILQYFGLLCVIGNLIGFIWYAVAKNFGYEDE